MHDNLGLNLYCYAIQLLNESCLILKLFVTVIKWITQLLSDYSFLHWFYMSEVRWEGHKWQSCDSRTLQLSQTHDGCQVPGFGSCDHKDAAIAVNMDWCISHIFWCHHKLLSVIKPYSCKLKTTCISMQSLFLFSFWHRCL